MAKKIIISILGIILLIFIFLIILGNLNKINNLDVKLIELDEKLDKINTRMFILELPSKGFINLTESSVQNIGEGFYVSKIAVEQHLTGVKVKGRIINSTSLIYETIKFEIEIASQKKEFTINRISPGNSTEFEVYVPNVPIDKSNYGTINYIESMVRYMGR